MVEKANCARSRGSRETAEKQGQQRSRVREKKKAVSEKQLCVVTLSGFEPELPP